LIRFGVIGTNWITESFIEAASQVEDFVLTAVYSRAEETGREFADKYSVQTIYTDIEIMAKSNTIDAVYIASPNSFHARQAITMMKNGIHVLCEKPLASNSAEVEEMVSTAQENNVLLMEALKTTLLPNFMSIKEHLHKIGKVRRYFANYCQYSSRYDAYKEGTLLNAFNPIYSNGSLMDLGIYCIYPLTVLFGKPISIKGVGYMLESGVDGEGSILLKYEEMDAVIMYSKISDSSLPSEIQGEEGRIIFDKIHTPQNVKIQYRDGSMEDISQPQESNSMYYEVKEFIDLIKNSQLESTVNSYKNTMITAEILEEVRKQIGLVYPADKPNS
jgi:predicted dehydrogenase